MNIIILVSVLYQVTAAPVGNYKDVYPERIHTTRHKRDLSTWMEGDHEDEVTYKLGDIIVDLKKREKIHPGQILVRSYDEETGEPNHKKVTPEQCYYDGEIRGNEDSYVHISTCNGLRGTIHDGKIKKDIQKIDDDGLHRILDMIDEVENIVKRLASDQVHLDNFRKKRDVEGSDESNTEIGDVNYQSQLSLFNVEEPYKEFIGENSKTKYIEMFVCADKGLYERYDSNVDTVVERILNAYSQVDKAYQAINIRIIIGAIDVWKSSSKFNRSTKAYEELPVFKNYWNDVIKKHESFKDIRMDNAQFLSNYDWEDAAGMAYVGGMCESSSVGINSWSSESINGPTTVLGHELGHNLNFPHDDSDCECLTTKGCFMGGPKSSTPGFSNCNMRKLQEKTFSCLNDYPESSLKPICGNGIKEDGEECDCGTEENCQNNNDHCCEPHACILKRGVQCSHVNFPACCSEQCFFRNQGTLCREKANDCDVEEYCPGNDEKCPDDQVKLNGLSCPRNPTILIGPTDIINETSINVAQPVNVRYLKFVFLKWTNDYYPGFKLEVKGCQAGDENCETDLLANLEDEAFSASSSYSSSWKPEKARSHGWIGGDKKGHSWFQVDLGEEYRINTITLKQAHTSIYGYNLFWSANSVENFLPYISPEDMEKGQYLTCYNGECVPDLDYQCKSLWNTESQRASEQCWEKFNIQRSDYGTCNSTSGEPCEEENMYCGQIQCSSNNEEPEYVKYANPENDNPYQTEVVNGDNCRGASIVGNEEAGLGMVNDGTKCGVNKICVQQECLSTESLPNTNCLQTCADGVCRNDGICHCQGNKNPNDGCQTTLSPINGEWSSWSEYGSCSLACGSGTQTRFRFCSNPYPQFGGNDCVGDREENQGCNTEDCPITRSCLALKLKLVEMSKPLKDGVYPIQVDGEQHNVFCDMTRHGGGWTLIVSSESNTWTEENVYERNKDNPSLKSDYSILKYANHLKDSYLIKADKFQYILEANFPDHWGGIWEAPNQYNISSTDKYLSNVKLLTTFNDWTIGDSAIGNRLPYVNNHALTTSKDDSDQIQYGSITDNKPGVHPSYWISGSHKLDKPDHVWYWVREGEYEIPVSCLEILKRGKKLEKDFPNGFYLISPDSQTPLKTFCDFTRHGGGWTLLIKKSSNNGWTAQNAGSRGNDISEQSLPNDFSIFNFIDILKGTDPAEATFQYMIEADGDNQNGGIFTYSVSPSLLALPSSVTKPNLLKKFGDWDEENENIGKFPLFLSSSNGVFVKASSSGSEDKLGSIISDGSDQNVGYMNSLLSPQNIKVWIREGGSRKSCNDIAIRGYHKEKEDYKNGLYLINNNQLVYCDMEKTKKEGWTLLVTSVSNGWTKDMVLSRNEGNPSISKDYSILSKGDSIKSLSTSETFKYMLDAAERHRWGGIFQASTNLSLIGDKKEETTQLEQFDTWGTAWYQKLSKILPYLGKESKGRALLTTTGGDEDNYESGTICAINSNGYHPAMWVDTNRNPGVIWYWLNENDCGSDYEKVDGGLSEWSTWTRCEPCIENQKKTRKKICNNPKPSCGGECDSLVEEANCESNCKVTKITSDDGEYCLEPESGCSADDNTKLVYRPHCNTPASNFAYDPDKGVIAHICSQKRVCVIGELQSGSEVILHSSCPDPTNDNAALRTVFETVQYGKDFCFQPKDGNIEDGREIHLSTDCKNARGKLLFAGYTDSPVETKYYKIPLVDNTVTEFMNHASYAGGQQVSGFIDNLIIPSVPGESFYQMKLSTYFKAPMTGDYYFVVAVDDKVQVYIGNVPGEDGMNSKKMILDVDTETEERFNFEKYPNQRSDKVVLEVGMKYYLEANMVQEDLDNYLTIGVYLPDETAIIPITSYYLSKDAADI